MDDFRIPTAQHNINRSPIEPDLFSVEEPFGGMGIGHPVQGLAEGLGAGGPGEAFFNEGALFGACGFRLCRDKEGGAATCQQLHPLFVLFPGDIPGQANAVGIDGIEGVVLREAEGEGVDAHFYGAGPFVAAGIVAGAGHDAGGQQNLDRPGGAAVIGAVVAELTVEHIVAAAAGEDIVDVTGGE